MLETSLTWMFRVLKWLQCVCMKTRVIKVDFGGRTHSDFPFWLQKISICERRAGFDTELGLGAKPSKQPQAGHKEGFLQR